MGKIKNPLPRPLKCDNCGSKNIRITQNSALYGRNYGDWPVIWLCKDCTAAVGCHAKTDIPLGRMADRNTRQMRQKTHEIFDPLWKTNSWLTRHNAYAWLAKQLGIPTETCHISWFDLDTCKKVIRICKTEKPMRNDYVRRKRKPKSKRSGKG